MKEVEEQAKAKAEKYEEGELSDSSSQKTSDLSEDPCNDPSLGSGNIDSSSLQLLVKTNFETYLNLCYFFSEGGDAAEPSSKVDDNSKRSKR